MKTLTNMIVSDLVKALAALMLIAAAAAVLCGCDFTVRGDLKRAEKALLEADRWKAETWAETEYRKAQKAFDEACILARNREVNAARDKAQEAFDWAEEAAAKSQDRQEAIEREQQKVGVYKN